MRLRLGLLLLLRRLLCLLLRVLTLLTWYLLLVYCLSLPVGLASALLTCRRS